MREEKFKLAKSELLKQKNEVLSKNAPILHIAETTETAKPENGNLERIDAVSTPDSTTQTSSQAHLIPHT